MGTMESCPPQPRMFSGVRCTCIDNSTRVLEYCNWCSVLEYVHVYSSTYSSTTSVLQRPLVAKIRKFENSKILLLLSSRKIV